jgi:hypothetical protein
MPIYLDEVPGNVDDISRPVTIRWVIFLVVIMLAGVVLTLWQWTGERRGISFWFTALGLPFCLWGILAVFRHIGQPLDIIPSEVEMPTNHIIRLDKATWQQITDKPEVTSVLSEWQKMPTSRAFPPCAQRSMVIKALNKSKESGLLSAADQKVYALYYLSGGRQELESDALRAALPNVMNETQSLAEVLVNLADTQY